MEMSGAVPHGPCIVGVSMKTSYQRHLDALAPILHPYSDNSSIDCWKEGGDGDSIVGHWCEDNSAYFMTVPAQLQKRIIDLPRTVHILAKLLDFSFLHLQALERELVVLDGRGWRCLACDTFCEGGIEDFKHAHTCHLNTLLVVYRA